MALNQVKGGIKGEKGARKGWKLIGTRYTNTGEGQQ